MGIIEIDRIIKRFGDFTAVNGISMDIRKGEIYGILGPNGSGKTTTINLLLGLIDLTSGSITVNGINVSKDPSKVRMTVGFMSQETLVDQDLTARENLEVIGSLYHIGKDELAREVKEALSESELTEFENVKAGTFSGGMQRRMNLVRAMMHNPSVIILDEPTTGLDVQNRVSMWNRIKTLNQNGITIILTTQYLEEADALCDRISILDHGKVIANGTPSELKRMAGNGDIIEISAKISDIPKIKELLKTKFNLKAESTSDRITAVIAKDPTKTLAKVADQLEKSKINVISIGLHLPTLDDVFIKLTGSTLRDTADASSGSRMDKVMTHR